MCGRYYIDDSACSEIHKLIRQIHNAKEEHGNNAISNTVNHTVLRTDFRTGDIRPSEPAPVIIGKDTKSVTSQSHMELVSEIMNCGFPQYDRKGLLINA